MSIHCMKLKFQYSFQGMPGDRQHLRQQLYRLAAIQAGYFTAAQALDLGYSYQAQKYHVDHANWVRVDRGLFRIPEWPPGLHDSLVRWVLWSKGRAVVSHDSAASAHNLGLLNPAKVHLTVPPGFRMRDDLVVLYHQRLPPTDVTSLDGAAVTTPLRTVIDIIEHQVDEELVATVVSDALESGAVSRRQVERRLDELPQEALERAERIMSVVST